MLLYISLCILLRSLISDWISFHDKIGKHRKQYFDRKEKNKNKKYLSIRIVILLLKLFVHVFRKHRVSREYRFSRCLEYIIRVFRLYTLQGVQSTQDVQSIHYTECPWVNRVSHVYRVSRVFTITRCLGLHKYKLFHLDQNLLRTIAVKQACISHLRRIFHRLAHSKVI